MMPETLSLLDQCERAIHRQDRLVGLLLVWMVFIALAAFWLGFFVGVFF